MKHIILGLVVASALVLAAAPPARANGILLTDAGNGAGRLPQVTLQRHAVEATIHDQVAQVSVEQVFWSAASTRLEGTYVFPLPEGAVVSGFAMSMGGTMVTGEVVEATKARAVYEDIVRRRRDPGLLEYLGHGLYRARVFPIEPHQPLTIRLGFQQILHDDAGTLEFRYPLATDRLNGTPVRETALKVSIESSVDLKAIYSPTHKVEIARDGERHAVASFEQADRRQDQDLLLYVGRSPEAVGFSMLSHKAAEQDGTFMAVIAPQTAVSEQDRAGRDVVFVLDTSGSMAGEKIEQARRALSQGVNTLGPKDRFAIVRFATATSAFRPSLVPMGPDVRRDALQWISTLVAGGGTDIGAALAEALKLATADRRCMVVLITDGRPTVGLQDAGPLLAQVGRENRHAARIFTFGVGFDLDVGLLDRLAEGSGGTRDYVAPREDIELVTSRFFRKVSHPVLTDVKLDLGPGVYDVYPREVGDLFAGSQVVLFGRYREAGERTIALTGSLEGRAVRHEFAGRFGAEAGPDYLERLWANRKVAFLLDEIRLHGRQQELVDEVVQLATRHAIVTPYTSGLVVEDGPANDRPRTDSDLPYEESFGQSEGMSDAPFEGPANHRRIGLGGGSGGAFRGRGGSRDLATGGGGRKRFDDAVDDALRWLAAHQRPDGSWSAEDYDAPCDGRPAPERAAGTSPARADHDLQATSQALLAFLAAGYTNRGNHPFAKVVSRAGRWLKNVQDPEGCFGPRALEESTLAHAQAALAMMELYGMTGSPIWQGSARKGLAYLAAARTPGGVWRRGGGMAPPDLRTTAWAVSVFHAANLLDRDAWRNGTPLPMEANASFLQDVRAWLDGVQDAQRGGTTSAALPDPVAPGDGPDGEAAHLERVRAAMAAWLRLLLGEHANGDAPLARALARLDDAHAARPWAEECYFGALAAFQAGGRTWDAWRHGMGERVKQQHTDGDYCGLKGSAEPRDPRARLDGRVGATALFALELTTFYRYDRDAHFTPIAWADPSAAAPPAKAAPTAESQELKRRKAAASASEVRASGRTRTLAGKTFVRDADGRWVDTAWDRSVAPTRVEALSEAYFALAARAPQAGSWLALGERLVIVLDGTAYEIAPAP